MVVLALTVAVALFARPVVVAIFRPAAAPALETTASEIRIDGTATSTAGDLDAITWHRPETGERGEVQAGGSWSVTVPLSPGPNEIVVEAVDFELDGGKVSSLKT